MAWIKIPAEHHALLRAALPRDPRVTTVNMFGALAAMVNGHMFGGLFARSAFVRLGPADQAEALALDGAGPFDPMGTGRAMASSVQLPDDVMDDPEALRDWMRRALAFTATLPPKVKKARGPKVVRPKATPAARPKATPAAKPKAKPAARPTAKPAARPKAKAAKRATRATRR
ncbi:MAG: TfoX/Sxy family protein [Kofleriaceae bacterium]|nr:TfoX/Sxy family protein [Kofleriaceae bacterium]